MSAGAGAVVLQQGNANATNASAGGAGGGSTLPETMSQLLGLGPNPDPAIQFVFGIIVASIIAILFLTVAAVAGIWGKRKITASFTDRIAVNRVGPFGLLIIVADEREEGRQVVARPIDARTDTVRIGGGFLRGRFDNDVVPPIVRIVLAVLISQPLRRLAHQLPLAVAELVIEVLSTPFTEVCKRVCLRRARR